jgi:putative transcriptional regulator
MKKEVEFNAEDFLRSVEDIRDHVQGKRKLTLRTSHVVLPPPVGDMPPDRIVSIRQRLNVSQSVFARLLNVPMITEVSWEKGRRRPSGAALRLLELAGQHPEWLAESSSIVTAVCERKAEYGAGATVRKVRQQTARK